MAELESTARSTSACCPAQAQASCCEPAVKETCCGSPAAEGAGCGCRAGASGQDDVRETVRLRYAEAAQALAGQSSAASVPSTLDNRDRSGNEVFGRTLYDDRDLDRGTAAAVEASLGCGVPTAVADLHEGETVLDLGSGAGGDVLISARRVGPSGRAIGLDMTDEMLGLARRNAQQAGLQNVEFVKGYLEELPIPDETIDVVISNCVINLSGDKPRVLAEAARVLKPGGRLAVSDVIADAGMDEAAKADMQAWTGCIAGALTEAEFRGALAAAGLTDIEIRETHRVHPNATAAIIRARKRQARLARRRLT
jgi:arsenite methyltransferase